MKQFTFKKAKKISKSVKRIESEISKIQIQMARIGKDLTTVLELIDTKKKS
jgi:DNA anti-recombination protein RmuC